VVLLLIFEFSFLKYILSIGEHEIVGGTTDGAKAVDFYQKYDPQVLLLNLDMSRKDGFIVVKEVIAYDPNEKIILITTSDD